MTDIEQALADALKGEKCVRGVSDRYGKMNDVYWEQFAAAILATEPMQAIARQAAIGAAVEQLPDRYSLWWYLADDTEPWWVCEDREGTAYDGESARAAIAAALGDDR